MFYNCTSLTSIDLSNNNVSKLSSAGSIFYNCTSLTQMSLPMCSHIDSGAFYRCRLLSIITIGYSSICSLTSPGVFDGTQITSSTGSIYVPASLVDAYKSANNWSYFKDRIFSIPS